jgi:hypothetical protein
MKEKETWHLDKKPYRLCKQATPNYNYFHSSSQVPKHLHQKTVAHDLDN